jgi:hypothetical protein
VLESVQTYVNSEFSGNAKLQQFWEALLERIKFTALKEGREIEDGHWSFVAEGAPKLNVPTIQVLFTHDQTSLTIHNALFWGLGDDDPDEGE